MNDFVFLYRCPPAPSLSPQQMQDAYEDSHWRTPRRLRRLSRPHLQRAVAPSAAPLRARCHRGARCHRVRAVRTNSLARPSHPGSRVPALWSRIARRRDARRRAMPEEVIADLEDALEGLQDTVDDAKDGYAIISAERDRRVVDARGTLALLLSGAAFGVSVGALLVTLLSFVLKGWR
jgi:hypothetical protein